MKYRTKFRSKMGEFVELWFTRLRPGSFVQIRGYACEVISYEPVWVR